jgi:hypothetical protein
MDANKNMTNGHMERMLSHEDIGMRPVTLKNHPDLPLTPMYMRGLQPGRVPVDEVWVTNDLPVDMAGWLTVHKCPGDHHVVMIEIDTKALLGDNLLWITRPPAQCLSCQIPRAKKNYQRRVISHFQKHRVLERLHRVYATSTTSLSTEQEQEMERIDLIRKEGMLYAKKMLETCNGGGQFFARVKQSSTMKAPMEEDCLAQNGEESQLLIHQAQGLTMWCPMPTKLHTGTGPSVQKDGNQ